jgi:heat shock protein HslJ
MMRKIYLFFIILLAGLAVSLSACAAAGSATGLAGSSWELVSYGPVGSQIAAAPGIDTQVDFGSDGRVSGNVGCNGFSGDYEEKNGSLIFDQMLSTMMACDEPRMSQESAVLQVMNGTARFEVNGGLLTIHAADGGSAITLSKRME